MKSAAFPDPVESAGAAELARLRGDLLTLSRRLPHDLGSPLACIFAAAESWAELPADVAGPSVAEAAARIHALGSRLGFVLRATAAPPPARPVRMEEILWNVMQRLETLREKSGATFVVPTDWPECAGVPAWIETIWENLLVNSLRHAGPRPRVLLGWTRAEDGVLHWLRDDGPGVAPAKRRLLFHPFERLHELDAPGGYGLPIIRRLVELQGGRCGHDPEPPPGGAFFFTLPEIPQTE